MENKTDTFYKDNKYPINRVWKLISSNTNGYTTLQWGYMKEGVWHYTSNGHNYPHSGGVYMILTEEQLKNYLQNNIFIKIDN